MKLFRKIAVSSDGDFLRDLTFCPGSLRPATDRYVRRVGRPRSEWATKVFEHAAAIAARNPAKMLDELLKNKFEFEQKLDLYISALNF